MPSSAIRELEAIVAPEFWQELTEQQRRWLERWDTLKQAWAWCGEAKILELIAKHARSGLILPEVEIKHQAALEKIARDRTRLAEAIRAACQTIEQLALDCPPDSVGRYAIRAIAAGVRNQLYYALHQDIDAVASALAWKYALPDPPRPRKVRGGKR